jgi:hypothetical protein
MCASRFYHIARFGGNSNAIFNALLKLWDHISAFALQDHIVLNELDDNVKIKLQILAQLTGQFSDA